MNDPERIYLEPACPSTTADGRFWAPNTDCFECDCEDGKHWPPTEYVRAPRAEWSDAGEPLNRTSALEDAAEWMEYMHNKREKMDMSPENAQRFDNCRDALNHFRADRKMAGESPNARREGPPAEARSAAAGGPSPRRC